jgi:phosphoglycolate phosphatase
MPAILLFDLDGTVVKFDRASNHSGASMGIVGPGRMSMDRAIERLFGVARASDGVRFAGGTDRAIARALLQRARVPDAEHEAWIPRVLDAYVEALDEVLQVRRYEAIGDVEHCVHALEARGHVVGVATGNIRRGARKKLQSAGLGAVFELERGGFGDDAEERSLLVAAAIARCRAAAPFADAWPVVVIGDTEHDASAARAVDALVVGVATSDDQRTELARAGVTEVVARCGPELVDAIERSLR